MGSAVMKLRSQMPQEIQDALDEGEEAKSFESEDCATALMYVLSLHACRTHPWPEGMMDGVAAMADDNTCYRTMSGTSPLTM